MTSDHLNGAGRGAPPAAALMAEADAISGGNGDTPLLSRSLMLAAWRGQESRVNELGAACVEDASARGQPKAISLAGHATAVLYNGIGDYPRALAGARRACELEEPGVFPWALCELIEAGARCGELALAAEGLSRFEERTRPGNRGWARGVLARSQALLNAGEAADALNREALAHLAGRGLTLHLARARLLYGEWLRREGRRRDARAQLRPAEATLRANGAAGYAERARRELEATGETARKRVPQSRDDLTFQEAQIVELAANGHTNPEIGVKLFISPRTVEWHLHKVFAKLEISSRRELRRFRTRDFHGREALRPGATVAVTATLGGQHEHSRQ